MENPNLAPHAQPPCGHHHTVEFYETEAFLVDTVGDFLVPALRGGDTAIVVATAAHRHEFETVLAAAGIDVGAAIDAGRYLAFDAADLLTQFMVDGQPDPSRFRETVDAVMDRACAGGRRIRVYGEMVALLWDAGDMASAVALEDLWNDLAKLREFALLCAYPMQAFDDEASTAAFARICRQHTTVIPSEGYSLVTDPAERTRAIAALQQENKALRAELLRLRAQGERGETGVRRDQAGVRRDQAGVQRDEAGVQRDQAGLDRDQVGNQRDHAGDQRDEAGVQRDEAGVQRDRAGVRRDRAADERDRAAEERDEVAERSEASMEAGSAAYARGRSVVARREAASDRRRASRDRRAGISERTDAEFDRGIALADRRAGADERTAAGVDRGTALADRGAGASERTEAERDRGTALADRGASATERKSSSQDDLTGAYLRGAGLVELARDIARARRAEQPLVVGFVDVDHLKVVNDSSGHAAGDRMLLEVVKTFRAKLRAHDLIIRYGGDEFVCVIPGLNIAQASARLAPIDAALTRAPERASVTVGLAELRPGDSPENLVARADAALYAERRRQRSPSR